MVLQGKGGQGWLYPPIAMIYFLKDNHEETPSDISLRLGEPIASLFETQRRESVTIFRRIILRCQIIFPKYLPESFIILFLYLNKIPLYALHFHYTFICWWISGLTPSFVG